MKKKIFIIIAILGLLPSAAKAHCPLCTAGAGALAVGAAYIGVNTAVVGALIGAFALALSLWVARIVKKQYIRYQRPILIIMVFLSTIIPLMPLIREYRSINLYLFGSYGSLLNRTYMFNLFIVGVIIGAIIMYLAPFVSAFIAQKRGGKMIPYQGIGLTFALLILVSLFIQFGL
ncbi:MAG: hypothetical protein WC862_05275 [Patescibacteria group bacterium]